MATTSTSALPERERLHTLSVVRLALVAGLTAGLVFVLCWLGTFIPFSSPTHAYISLFTDADTSSGLALAQGTCWSLLFGGLVGSVLALIYNATAALERK